MLTTTDKRPNWLRTIILIFAAIGLFLTINFVLRSCQPEPALTDAGQAETKKAAVIKAKIDSVSDAAVVKSDKSIKEAIQTKKLNQNEKYIPVPDADFRTTANEVAAAELPK